MTVAEVVALRAEFTIKGTAETVEVKGLIESPVEVESSQVSNIVDTTRMTNLPLLTRNPYELVLLSPGSVGESARDQTKLNVLKLGFVHPEVVP